MPKSKLQVLVYSETADRRLRERSLMEQEIVPAQRRTRANSRENQADFAAFSLTNPYNKYR